MNIGKHIYFDYNSTTPIDERVLDRLMYVSRNYFGNSGSKHKAGNYSDKLVSEARSKLASLISCNPSNLFFTSGSTESLNLGIQGFVKSHSAKGKHIVAVTTEHKAVLETYKELENLGFDVSYLSVDSKGNIDFDELDKLILPSTILVSIMFVNNETGVINPIHEIAKLVHEKGSFLLTDATQAVGKINVNVQELDVDLLALSGHKFYAPKGTGALYIKPGISIIPIQFGGGQEMNLRSGTLNVPSIAAFGEACEIAQLEMNENEVYIKKLRDLLEYKLLKVEGSYIHGDIEKRIFNVTNICLPGEDARVLIGRLSNVSLSNGSACNSRIDKPSHVLTAMGISTEDALCSLRFSLGKFNTVDEVNDVVDRIYKITSKPKNNA